MLFIVEGHFWVTTQPAVNAAVRSPNEFLDVPLRIAMAQITTCRQCGASLSSDTRAGLCPSCLVQVGIELNTPSRAPAETNSSADTDPSLPYVFGDYELLEQIARGGMGVVYKAKQISLSRTVAVKMILAGELASRETVLRFRAEAESAASLRHPHIVAIYETGEVDGQHYFSMEHIEGQNLTQLVQDSPLTAKRAAVYMEKVAKAVEYAHQQDVLHRDLKPSNVLVDSRDEPRVTDFGLAKKLTYDSALTLSGQLLGSPNFMPPEQASSKRGKVGRQSDVYGLGALLYHLLTGVPPFQAATLEETLGQVFDQEPVSPRDLNPGVPPDLETICLKCLEKDSHRRYPTAQAVAEELTRFLRDEPIEARPIGPAGKVWRWCRRKPRMAGLAAAVLLLLLTLAVGGPIAAARQAALAESNRMLAEENRANAYTSGLAAAWHSWNIGNISHCNNLLEQHIPGSGQTELREFTWRYLRHLATPPKETQSISCPHHVYFLAVSPDERRFAATGAYGALTIWDAQTRRIEHTIDPNLATLFPGGVTFSPDGQTLVTTGGYIQITGSPSALQIWDVATGDKITEVTPGGYPGAFSPNGNRFAFGRPVSPNDSDFEIVVLDVSQGWLDQLDGMIERRWPAHSEGLHKGIHEVTWSPDGTRLISAGNDHMAIIWDAESGQEIDRLVGHKGYIYTARFSPPDLGLIATASEDTTVRFWDAVTYEEIASDRYAHAVEAMNLTWSPDGQWVASASMDGLVKLRNMTTRSDWTLRGHGHSIVTLRFTRDSATLITASMEGTIQFWELEHLPPNDVLQGRLGTLFCPMAISPDSRSIATVDANGTEILVWDVATGALQAPSVPITPSDLATRLAVTPEAVSRWEVLALEFISDDQLAAACRLYLHSEDSKDWPFVTAIYDLQNNALVDAFPGGPPIKVLLDGKHLAIQGEPPYTLRIRDLTRKRTRSLPNFGQATGYGELDAFAFSADGTIIAASVIEKEAVRKLYLLEASTGDLLTPVGPTVRHTPTRALALTTDGTRLITSGFDPRIHFWEVATGEPAFPPMEGHVSLVRSMAISPDGKTLVTGSRSGVLKFWNLERRAELLTLQAHRGAVNTLAFSPDGNTLASAGQDGTVRLFRAAPKP